MYYNQDIACTLSSYDYKDIQKTHRTTASKHNEEALYSASGADDPCQTDEEDDTKDVLDTRQVAPNKRAHACGWRGFRSVWVRRRRRRNGVGIICQGTEERGRTRSVFNFVLCQRENKLLRERSQ